MPVGTLDIMKMDESPADYQVMFEENAGGTFVATVDEEELLDFLHEEMRLDLPVATEAAQKAETDGRVRIPDIFLEENNLHAIMDYQEVEDLGEE
ncbi:MAG TPA: hypothetical protein VJA94_05850 [Candidatus Angelobacter sp.]